MSAAVLSPAGPGAVRPNLRVVRLSTPPAPRSVAPAGRTAVATGAGRDDAGARATAEQAPLRLTARGRLVVVVLGLLLAIGVSTIAARASADGPVSSAVEVTRHVVLEGETMWGLAQQVAAPGEDVRDVVLELVRLNDLPNAGLMAGQEILLPRS
ncbi:LysM peptidoglycan-binding domain-containing protein [Cellulomonas septica]|uniref:LysM peptidoglycan-binding domain-containing protein n=1 Tax=Cellulomonas septica TaxID=285080 RepID=A0ABX1JZV8_9CELL|nr:LysM peptidoglycan-binding domain-containing protein [Cellulomonas septica]NKY39481.1 LysM peptidoglycan-binding domain-containing protein [Cellulomonas septica]